MKACEMPGLQAQRRKLASQSHGVLVQAQTLFLSGRRPSKERDWSLARFQVPDQPIDDIADVKPVAFGTVDYIPSGGHMGILR
jgi:hypothetical protein